MDSIIQPLEDTNIVRGECSSIEEMKKVLLDNQLLFRIKGTVIHNVKPHPREVIIYYAALKNPLPSIPITNQLTDLLIKADTNALVQDKLVSKLIEEEKSQLTEHEIYLFNYTRTYLLSII